MISDEKTETRVCPLEGEPNINDQKFRRPDVEEKRSGVRRMIEMSS